MEELLEPATGEWDCMKVRHNFIAADAEVILRIPVGKVMEDTWAWQPDKLGFFSVRSAYKSLIQHNRVHTPGSSAGTELTVWEKLWRLAIPPKVRNFWWRVINKFVPT